MTVEDRLEILPVALLVENHDLVDELKRLAKIYRQEFGWHYLLDLVWIIRNLEISNLRTVLDAGAGEGLMQWYLAAQGINVISVDRIDRSHLPLLFRRTCVVEGLRPEDLAGPLRTVILGGFRREGLKFPQRLRWIGRDLFYFLKGKATISNSGKVILYNRDLCNLTDLVNDSVDAVVAVSSLEHNPPESLPVVVAELMRVLKPGGKLVASLSTIGAEDGYHVPSSGWMYSETSMKKCFGLDADAVTNFSDYPLLLEQIRNSSELRNSLAKFYFRSEKGGMPRGIWDPQYVPVGVCKNKPLG